MSGYFVCTVVTCLFLYFLWPSEKCTLQYVYFFAHVYWIVFLYFLLSHPVHTYVCMCINALMYSTCMYVCMYVCVCMYINGYIWYVCMDKRMSTNCMFVSVCMYACMYACRKEKKRKEKKRKEKKRKKVMGWSSNYYMYYGWSIKGLLTIGFP